MALKFIFIDPPKDLTSKRNKMDTTLFCSVLGAAITIIGAIYYQLRKDNSRQKKLIKSYKRELIALRKVRKRMTSATIFRSGPMMDLD